MISKDQIQHISGGKAVDNDGDKIGSVGQVYLDDATGEPEWMTVSTGLFGTSETFIPLRDAQVDGDTVRVPYSKDKVKDAPRVDADQHLDHDQERELYRYYDVAYDDSTPAATGQDSIREGRDDAQGTDRVQDTDRDTRARVDADGAADGTLVAHEEQLKVGTQSRESGRVRMRKYVTTEERTVTVPVRREELRVERVPVEGDVPPGEHSQAFTESDETITLHEEVPVVGKETRAVEQVRIGVDEVTEERTVSDEVRKEHIDVDTDGTADVEGSRPKKNRR